MKKLAISISLAIAALVGLAPAASASTGYADVWASPSKIYPRADGYLDVAKIHLYAEPDWGSDDCIAQVEVDFVRVETGGVVASRTFGQTCRGSFSETIRWNGRDVPLGHYRVEVDFRNDWGQTVASGSTTVTTDSGEKTFRKWINRDGMDFASRTKIGNCNWGTQPGRGILSTCAGGTARVVYRATAPRGFEIAAVRTYVHGGIIGCKADRWTKSISGRNVVATWTQSPGQWTPSQCDLDGILITASKTVRI